MVKYGGSEIKQIWNPLNGWAMTYIMCTPTNIAYILVVWHDKLKTLSKHNTLFGLQTILPVNKNSDTTEGCWKSVKILSTAAQLYKKLHFKRPAIGAWFWRLLKVIRIAALLVVCSKNASMYGSEIFSTVYVTVCDLENSFSWNYRPRGDRLWNGSPYASGPLSCLSVCLSVTFVHCGQRVGRIKMKLGMQVGLGPGHIVLDGDQLPPKKGRGTAPHPHFSAHVYYGQTVAHLSNCWALVWFHVQSCRY